MTGPDRTRLIRLDVSLSEESAARLFRARLSPTEFVEFVLREISVDEWISLFESKHKVESVPAADVPTGKASVSSLSRRVTTPPEGRHLWVEADGTVRGSPWTRTGFMQFMDVVVASKDFESPLRLLDAYTTVGPSPTSAELRTTCGIADENQWQQELRAAKARLTIFARRMGHPSLFPRAQTTEKGRMHPIDPVLYSWLVEWSQGNHGLGSKRDEEPQVRGSTTEGRARGDGDA